MRASSPAPRTHIRSFRRYLVFLVLIPLGYLCEVCVIPYFRIFGVAPNLLYAVIAIVTVAYGKLRAFWAALIYALLMEIMVPSIRYFNLALYTLTSMFTSFAFADKPIKRLEYNRALNREKKEMPAWLRTVLCAAVNVAAYETIQVTYIYLNGADLTAVHILKGLWDVVYTAFLTFVIQFPVRRLIFGKRKEAPVLGNAPVI